MSVEETLEVTNTEKRMIMVKKEPVEPVLVDNQEEN
jgi:hypothetical protein